MTMPHEGPVRIGLLGAARIAPAALVEPARQRRDVRLVSVAARDPLRARAFADQHGFEDASVSYAELVTRDDIDLVYVALPPDRHCEWTIAALEAGKAVLCEKPFALDADEARLMVGTAARTGAVLIEAFHYRFHRLMREAVALVRGGAIGTPVTARAVVDFPIPRRDGEPRWSAAMGGGAMMDLGCYGVHGLRTLLGGEPEILSAQARLENGVDAATEARLLFPGGAEAELRTRMDPPAPFTEIVIDGRSGRLEIGGFVLPQRSGRLRLTAAGETREVPIEGPSSYAAQLEHVLAVLRGEERQLTGGEDAIATMRAVDRIRACAGR
jgi:predicted dehydrogenase